MQSMSQSNLRKGNYFPIMNQQNPRGKKFCVIRTGKCDISDDNLAQMLRDMGLTEARSLGECDYVVVFCPIASRVATDISEAEERIPGGKPAVLVVMHPKHTPDGTVGDSRKHVTSPNIHLTVDCLFHRDNFLECDFNYEAWNKIQRFFDVDKTVPGKKSCSFTCCVAIIIGVVCGAVTIGLAIHFGMAKD